VSQAVSPIIRSAEELTPEWFAAVLEVPVTGVELEPVGGGLIARSARAKLAYDGAGGPASVVVKYATDDAGSFGLARAMRMYELECAFYRDVAPVVTASVPACHLALHDPDSGHFTLVLEDLSAHSRPGDVLTLGTLDEASTVLGELVGLQAPTWNDPQLLELPWLADRTLTLQMFDQFPLGLGPFVERFGDRLDPDHVVLFESVLPRAGDWARSWEAPTVVQHGDFRTDNVMFGASPGAAPVTIIDFQTVRLGPPGVDLAYFIGASLSTEDRRAGDHELIAEYHGRLAAAGVEGFSFEDCWQSYREGALYGVFLFVGLASQVESTERGDQVIAEQIKRYAGMAIDLDAAGAAGL